MSIATVVTRGYGSFGSIAYVATHGYDIGAVEARRGGAGAFTDDEIIAHKLRQRRMLAKLPTSKLSTEELQLLAALADQFRQLQELPQRIEEPELEDELEEAVTAALEAPERPQLVIDAPEPYRAEQASEGAQSLRDEIRDLKDTIQRIIKAREDAEEDDIETIIMLMH